MSPPTPYYPARPGDPLLSDTWNNLQLRIQQELAQHDHKEGRGAPLDGSAIAPSAELKVNKLEATVSLTVRGVDVLTKLNELGQQHQQMVSRTGGLITGSLSMLDKVGIGTEKPGRTLTVVHLPSSGDRATVEIQGRGNHSHGVGLMVRTTGEGNNGASILLRTRSKSWQMRGETAAGDNTGFQITEGGGESEHGHGFGLPRLHISAGGNVGIGTTTPNKLLTLVTPASHHAPMEIRGRGDYAWGIGLVVRTTAEGNDGASILLRTRDKSWQVRGESGANATGFQISEGGGDEAHGKGPGEPRLHIRAGGQVGIGMNATHEHQLAVKGNVRISEGALTFEAPVAGSRDIRAGVMYVDAHGSFIVSNARGQMVSLGASGGWQSPSDLSLKTNVKALEGILERVLSLRPVSFDWKSTNTRSLGLVAQDVEAVFPELVGEHAASKSLSYELMGVLAIAGLQELKRQYDARLQALEARLP